MSNKLKLSQWHSSKTFPKNIGIYEIRREIGSNKDGTMYSYFDGESWCGWVYPFDFDTGYYPDKSHFVITGQNRQWRGIVK